MKTITPVDFARRAAPSFRRNGYLSLRFNPTHRESTIRTVSTVLKDKPHLINTFTKRFSAYDQTRAILEINMKLNPNFNGHPPKRRAIFMP